MAKSKAEGHPQRAPEPTVPKTAVLGRRAWALFAAALLLRLGYWASIRHAPFFSHLLTEPGRYHAWAGAILDGAAHLRPPFDEAPGYPYAVAALYALFGRGVTPVAIVQAIVDAGSCVGLALVCARLGGVRAGWIAGGMAAAYGPLIYFSAELLPATLLVAVVVLALVATPAGEASPGRWLGAGAAWAAGLLIRSEVALAIPVLFVHAYWSGGRRALGRAAIAPAALVLLSLSVNVASSHYWVPLTTGSGVNLWLGNNASADGVSPFIHGSLAPVAEEVGSHATNPVEADALFRGRAVEFIREHPGQVLRLALRKFLWTWTDRELPNTSDIDWETGQSGLFVPPVFPLRLGLLLPLAMAGAVLLGRGWRRHAILAAPVAMALGTSVIFFTNARFRLGLCATVIPLAGLAVDRLVRAAPRWREHVRELRLAVVGLAMGSALSWGDWDGVREYRISQIDVNTGGLERQAGRFPEAIHYLQLGVAEDPSDAGAWVELALAQEQAGRRGDAMATFRKAMSQLPGDPTLRQLAARFLRGGP